MLKGKPLEREPDTATVEPTNNVTPIKATG